MTGSHVMLSVVCSGAALALMGCIDASGPPADGTLDVTEADGGRFQATVTSHGDVFTIRSEELSPGAVATADEIRTDLAPQRLREITIENGDGQILVRHFIDLDTGEVVGDYAGHSFGRLPDADTDEDAAYWAPVRASDTGQILASISARAATLASDGTYPAARDTLGMIAQIGERLDTMASTTSAAIIPEDAAVCIGYATVKYHPECFLYNGGFSGTMVATSHPYVAVKLHEWYYGEHDSGTYWSTAHTGEWKAGVQTAVHGLYGRTKGWWQGTTQVRWSGIAYWVPGGGWCH